MSFVVRPSHPDDLEALYEMAKLTGAGFTNLPPNRDSLVEKLARSAAAFGAEEDALRDDLYLFVLEDDATGQIRGTAQIFSQIGQRWPFYSYRRGTLTKHSRELGRSFRAEMLTLTTDLEGASEVGGLFLHPLERAGGLGLLLARSRYLFIKAHRARFADRIIAELRGVIDEAGGSPFWDGLAGRFFGMAFQEADEFNATHGNQFIADLMPKSPIYSAMLTEAARAVIGVPHPGGRAAMRMLESEGFTFQGYVDIFDGGPTVQAEIDRLRSIAGAREATLALNAAKGRTQAIVAAGRLDEFRAGYALLADSNHPSEMAMPVADAERLGLRAGDRFNWVPRV